MTQNQALDILKMGKNVFITGPAGSGKTFVVNQYIRYLKEHGVAIGITASTGIAATHMGGITIHSWSGMGLKNNMSEYDLADLLERTQVVRRIKEASVLIIDEVSMLHHFRLDTLNTIAQHVRKNKEPFGGLQIVLCGDFFQLPPIAKYGEPDTHFIYRSEAWRDGKFTVCYLHENYRHISDDILFVLNEVRAGKVSDAARSRLNGRRNIIQNSDSEFGPTRLFTHNVDVDKVNDLELNKVQGHESTYEMTSKGKKSLVDGLKKSCLAPTKLRLKKGARVMCVKNNFDQGYVNGTLGVVVSCGYGIDPVIHTASTPDFPSGRRVTIELADWTIEDDGRVLAKITQYPLRLAWAITVHKSQGMSLDSIEVDLSKAFEPGMGYVALSRVRTLAGLSIIGINENALKVHPEVLEYDKHLRELSGKAESVIEYTDTAEIIRTQEGFLAKVAPLHRIGRKAQGSNYNEGKPEKVSTFQRTVALIQKQKSVLEIAKERKKTIETIIHHIEKLIEVGSDRGGLNLSDISYLKKEISPIHFLKIEKALEEVSLEKNASNDSDENKSKPPLLSAIKRKVEPNISFREIQLVRVLLGYVKRGERVSDSASH
ncbi:MAG: AAA family ATPase [Patescibacteria group bacterium]